MVVGQCFLFPLLHLLLSPHSISGSSDSHTCSPVGPSQQLENQHLAFLGLNKAAVYICQAAHGCAHILCLYGVRVKAVSGSLRPCFFGNNSFYASCNFTLVLWKEEFKLIRITKKIPKHIFYVFRERTTKTAGKCYSGSVGGRVFISSW